MSETPQGPGPLQKIAEDIRVMEANAEQGQLYFVSWPSMLAFAAALDNVMEQFLRSQGIPFEVREGPPQNQHPR